MAISAYLEFLALERNVAPATQKQALNARVFLVKNGFGIKEFTLDHFTPAAGQRRPPVVMTRAGVRFVIAHLEDPWKLASQIMYGSGLRIMETLRLRVQDINFGQGTITIHDGKGGKHRVVPLPKSLEQRLTEHLASGHEKHLQNLELCKIEIGGQPFILFKSKFQNQQLVPAKRSGDGSSMVNSPVFKAAIASDRLTIDD